SARAYKQQLAAPQGTAAIHKSTAATTPRDRASLVPTNVPIFRASRPPAGMSVAAILYRGPAAVRFEPEGFVSVKNAEEMEIKAIFTEPGTYVVRIIAGDGRRRSGNNGSPAGGRP